MRHLLILTLLISLNSLSQVNYTIDKDAVIYDLPGDEFLTANKVNDTIFLKHYDITGMIIWEDVLLFTPSISPVYINKIVRFKNTDEYLISIFADPTPQTVFWQSFSNDTLVYQFTKFNILSHTFLESYVDTFTCKSIDLLEFRDTSIYLFVTDFSIDSNPFNHSTYYLNSSLELNLIAPLDSIYTYPWGWSFYSFGDTIFRYQSVYDIHIMSKFSSNISLLETNYYSISTNQEMNQAFFRKIINYDSLFVFTQGYTPGSFAYRWKMNWQNLKLNTISTNEFNSPISPDGILRYSVFFNSVEIDRRNKRIYVLATHEVSPAGLGPNPQKIFVYDYNFNLICEIPEIYGNSETNSLILLNDLVFLKVKNQNYETLYELNCDFLGNQNQILLDEFDIYPNPTQSKVYISNPENKKLISNLLTTDGKQLLESVNQEILFTIDLSSLPNGLYLIKISDGLFVKSKLIIKE